MPDLMVIAFSSLKRQPDGISSDCPVRVSGAADDGISLLKGHSFKNN